MTENQLNVLYCPKCGHSNTLHATRCVECGLVFPSTIPVDDLVPDAQPVTSLETPSAKARLEKAGTIVFSIAGHDRPLFVRRQPEITLGRSAPGEIEPTVDLNPFRGQKMGVSRRHAVIRLMDDKAMIEDLGSVNGSWLNENKLEPRQPHVLNTGDYLRLGHLIMVIHASAIDTLVLVDSDMKTDKRLTTTVLTEQVGPFLGAVTELQDAINALTGRRLTPVTIHSMNAGARGAIHVRLSGATETLDLLREEIMPWRHRHIRLLTEAKTIKGAEAAAAFAAANTPTSPATSTPTSTPTTTTNTVADTAADGSAGISSVEASIETPADVATGPLTSPPPAKPVINTPANPVPTTATSPTPNTTPDTTAPNTAADSIKTPPMQTVQEIQTRFHNAYRMLYKAVLDRIAAGQTEEAIAPHRAALAAALSQLAFNPLEMSSSSVSGDLIESEQGGTNGTQNLFKTIKSSDMEPPTE